MFSRFLIRDDMSHKRYNHIYKQEDNAVHGNTSMENPDGTNDIISQEQMIFIMRILMFIVTPAISIFGIVGNIFSIIILYKHGLHKCSNILLISLAVADLTYLVAFNSVPKILYQVVGIEDGYNYNREISVTLFILYHFFNLFDYTASYISVTIPMFITFERVIAVYFPFKFNLIVTPRRTWCAVIVICIFWFAIVLWMTFWWTFSYTFDSNYNVSVGRMERSSLYKNRQNSVKILDIFTNNLYNKIAPVTTLVGCIFISVKVWTASRQRRRMTHTSQETGSNRSTKMLLAVCVVYVIACAVLSLPSNIPQYMRSNIFGDAQSNLGPIMYQLLNIVLCINSSANFIVYVIMNKKFRDTYKSLFACAVDQNGNH